MTAIAIAGGVRVDAPDGMDVAAVAPTRAGAADPVVRALADPEVSVAVSAALGTPAPTRGARRRPAPATVAVDVAPGERAVLLVERDGVYEWVLPDQERHRAPTRGDAGGAELVFTVAPVAPGAPTRGLLSSASSAVMHVLRFPGHLVGTLAIRHLERNVRTGMVSVTGDALSAWRRTDRAPRLPRSRPARVLLLVHGTFSSTTGGFGGLTRTPEGRELLAAALKHYDAVLGHNHRTLSVDPFDNAQEYLDMLLGLDAPKGIRIDAIAHSRGGLTVRSLIERLLPAHPSIVVEKAILVACTNGGTQLARPANWKALLDVYTNVAIAGATIGGGVVAPILSGALTGVSALAKYLVSSSVGEAEAIPGLAAMNPDGPFVAAINAVQPGEPTAEGIVYDILTSDYEPIGAAGDGVAAKLNKALKDAAVDRLMRGVENDGVVDVGGMRTIGPTSGYVDDELHFTATEGVNHSGYFVNPQAVRRMAAWLGLAPPAASAPAPKASRSRARARTPAPSPAAGKAAWTVMVYQAGFNNLNEFAVKDLKEMQAARLDPAVRLAVFQCRNDAAGERVAFQTLVGSTGALDDRTELEGVDSGRPGTVLDFARWAIARAPAERYALVLWSHGNGWEPEDFDELYTAPSGRPLARGSLRAGAAARRTLFLDSALALVKDPDKRNILVDDGTGHSLDTLELARVVKDIRAAIDQPLDLLGMDACLMNCVEIAYELRNDVRAIVGSQEEEPGDGWPYTKVLADLSADPALEGAAWAERIASRYVDSYRRSGEHVTQSVLDLTEIRSLVTPLKALAAAIAAACADGGDRTRRLVRLAVMDTLSFPRNSGTQVDLLGLCAVLRQSGLGAAVDRACDRVTAALEPGGVVAARHASRGAMAAAGGISIYLPADPGLVSEEYRRLAFARAGGWGTLLEAVHPG